MIFFLIRRFIIFAFYGRLPSSVLRENYENNECKTSHSNTNTPLFVMIKTVFCLFPPGLSEVKCQPGVMTWAAGAQTLSQETDNLPRAAASWAEAERPKWEKPQTLNILSTTNFKF